jgi:hypothetical protein
VEPNEQLKFYQDQQELIFTVLTEKWNELEVSTKKGGKTHTQEVVDCLEVLKKIVTLLQPQIKRKWKYDKIGAMIQQSLMVSNKPVIRLTGYSILLYFIEGLQTPSNEQIEEQIVWFSGAVNLKPFLKDSFSGVKLKNLPLEGSVFVECVITKL